MSRIATTFQHLQAQGKKALIPYLMTGFPEKSCTPALMHAAVQAGVDIIELGVPFSDPMADGPVVQQAAEQAIANGVDVAEVFAAVRSFRQADQRTPVVLMGYANSVESYNLHHGAQAFVRDAASARAVAENADAVVIGSKILQLIDNRQDANIKPNEAAASFLQGIRAALDA